MIVFQLFRFYVMRHCSRYGVNGALEMTSMNYDPPTASVRQGLS